ncbi:DUF3119 family protein [Pseudanabaena sp. PCC 6802]|uniref:DUF3119 family protein n=1 Tax=Pseudanabaena sp. PCC 6802 TaxID=118173 RepID=UPI000348B0BA|nr:DUF3119 family protein [Pseudanabaena sp. PCC 6802]
MNTANPAFSETSNPEATKLEPSFAIPVTLVLLAIPLLLVQVWLGIAIAIFGLFLLFQTVTLRLFFTATALDIYRSDTLIRRFPYQDWQTWRIFSPSFPVLFYFKEVKSIHFLPILFDPKTLQACLEKHLPLSQSQ